MIHRTFRAFPRNGVGAAIVGTEDDTGGKDISSTAKTFVYIGIGAVVLFMLFAV